MIRIIICLLIFNSITLIIKHINSLFGLGGAVLKLETFVPGIDFEPLIELKLVSFHP